MKRVISTAVLVAAMPALSGCGVAACCYVGMHPIKTANAIQYGVDRVDPRKRAEDFKRITEGDLRDRDFTAYVAFVVSELRLKDVLEYEMSHEEYTFGWRLDTVDGFVGPDGGTVTARLEVIPDYGKLVNEGVKTAFGFWGKILPDSLVTRIGRDLTLGNRFVGQFLNVGVDETDVEIWVDAPSGATMLGVARTDVSGRAILHVDPGTVPMKTLESLRSGAYPLVAHVAKTHLPPGLTDPSKVSEENGGLLFLRHAHEEAPKVAIVNVSNTVFDLDSAKSIWSTLREQKYELMDACTQPALDALAKTHEIVFLSGNPEGMAPLMREELARRGLLGDEGKVPLVFKPNDIAAGHESMVDFKARALAEQKKFWGDSAVDAYVGDDADVDAAAAKQAGVPFLLLPKQEAGGWCAGIPPLVPAKGG